MVPDKYFKAFTLIFVFVNSVKVNSAVACAANQYKVVDSSGSIWCTDCPTCPEGQEIYPQCGSNISTNDQSECRLCKEGKTFSSKEDVWSCMSCGHCANDQVVFKNCTKYTDIVCEKKCQSIDKYYDDNGSCMSCSRCCGDEKDIHVKECQQKLGDASDKVCAFHNRCETTPTVAKQNSSQANERNPVNVTTHRPTKLGITRVEITTAVQLMPNEDNKLAESSNYQGVHKADILAPVVCGIITFFLLLVVFHAIFRLLKGIRGHCGGQDIERLSKGNCHSSTSEPAVLFSKLPSSDASLNLSQVFIVKDEIKPQSPKKARSLCKKGTTMVTIAKHEGRESKELLLNKKGSETWNSSYQDSKKLTSLLDHGSDLVDKICNRLDTPVKGCGGYSEIAAFYGFGYFERKATLEKSSEGPTKTMFVWLAAVHPNLSIQDFIMTVKTKTKRNDVVQLLEKYDNSKQ